MEVEGEKKSGKSLIETEHRTIWWTDLKRDWNRCYWFGWKLFTVTSNSCVQSLLAQDPALHTWQNKLTISCEHFGTDTYFPPEFMDIQRRSKRENTELSFCQCPKRELKICDNGVLRLLHVQIGNSVLTYSYHLHTVYQCSKLT